MFTGPVCNNSSVEGVVVPPTPPAPALNAPSPAKSDTESGIIGEASPLPLVPLTIISPASSSPGSGCLNNSLAAISHLRQCLRQC